MKTFITKSCVFIVLVLLPAPLTILLTHKLSSRINWKLPAEKHILFMGASHIVHGIDDSLTQSAINLGKESERYMFTYIKLQHLLNCNGQVDTIFLECASTDLFEHADDKYFKDNEMTSFFATYYPLFNLNQWSLYKEKIGTAFTLLYRKTIVDYIRNIDYTYFSSTFPSRSQVLNRDSVYYKPVGGKYGNSINYEYLRKIIKLCENKGIKLYLLYCPVYKPELYYDQDYFYGAYRENFSEIELLDYSHFPMNDNERYDAHHLNDKGAIKFTMELKKRFGIN